MLFAVTAIYSSSYLASLAKMKVREKFQELSDRIAFEINLAAKAGDGYAREFFVPSSVEGVRNFSVEVGNYEVRVKWDGESVTSTILVKDVQGIVHKGRNVVMNAGGVIHVG